MNHYGEGGTTPIRSLGARGTSSKTLRNVTAKPQPRELILV